VAPRVGAPHRFRVSTTQSTFEVVVAPQSGRRELKVNAVPEQGRDEAVWVWSISPCDKGESSMVSERPGSRSGTSRNPTSAVVNQPTSSWSSCRVCRGWVAEIVVMGCRTRQRCAAAYSGDLHTVG
jgi:hypothetical protein